MNPSDSCKSRTAPVGVPAPSPCTDARLALLAWLRSCPPAELRQVLAALPFARLQQLHELFEFDPPEDDTPSLALSQAARTAVLAHRCARGLSLWLAADLVHRADLDRLGRIVARRRNGSIAVGELARVDYTPPDDGEDAAAELAADAAAITAGHGQRGNYSNHPTTQAKARWLYGHGKRRRRQTPPADEKPGPISDQEPTP